jgi:voltage-dependent calcium channel
LGILLIARKKLDAEAEIIPEERPLSFAQRWYEKTKIIWIALIAADLTIQALRTASMTTASRELLSNYELDRKADLDITESVATAIFALEIIVRFVISFPDWRAFFRRKTNCVDLFIAVATSVIQIPAIRNSSSYGWLTIFQIMRVYRIIIALPITRDLLVLYNSMGLLTLRAKFSAMSMVF